MHQDIVWPTGKVTASSPGAVVKETAQAGEAAPPGQPVAPVSPQKDRKISAKVAAPPRPETATQETVTVARPAPAQESSRPSVSREEGYRLGPRDVISVNVFAGGEKQISEDVSVAADGQITLPLFGAMQAAGLTLGELRRQSIEPMALKYFVEPQVNVAIKEYHSLSFYISGSIRNPGHYELDKEPTMLELIAKAGGLGPDYGHKAYIMREKPGKAGVGPGKPIVIDMKALLDQGDMKNNIRLATGDVVHIPRGSELNQASNAIFVEGEVKKPGVYTFQQGITALSACILAGGFNDYAAPNRARIIRRKGSEQEVIELNLDAVKKGKAKDVELQPGDLVHIPDSWL